MSKVKCPNCHHAFEVAVNVSVTTQTLSEDARWKRSIEALRRDTISELRIRPSTHQAPFIRPESKP